MAQQVEHVLGKDEVTGSSPVSSSTEETAILAVFFIYNIICYYIHCILICQTEILIAHYLW